MAAELVGMALGCWPTGLGSAFSGAESAHQIDDQTDEQDQAESAAAVNGTAIIETAAAEQEQQYHQD